MKESGRQRVLKEEREKRRRGEGEERDGEKRQKRDRKRYREIQSWRLEQRDHDGEIRIPHQSRGSQHKQREGFMPGS